MNIAVLGAGNGGCAVAGDLAARGHAVTLVKTSRAMHNENFAHLQRTRTITLEEGAARVTGTLRAATEDLAAVSDARVVIVYIQTNYHEALLARLAPHLRDGQVLLLNPGYLSTAYALRLCTQADITVAEATSSFIDCRIREPGVVRVGFRNVHNQLGIYPARRLAETQKTLEELGFPFTYFSSVTEAALHNPNLVVHTVGAIMSIPRIERMGEAYCMYHEVFTPSVWRILEGLDGEKMDVLAALGFERLPYAECCKRRNSLDGAEDAKAVFFRYAAMPTRAKGPVVVDSRYISEDVPQGLVLLESLGAALAVKTPVCTALIELANAALGRDLRAEGRTLERLGEEAVRRILADGRAEAAPL